jgi:hypothetical protein
MFVDKRQGAYPRVELKYVLVLTNIKLGWKGLPGKTL